VTISGGDEPDQLRERSLGLTHVLFQSATAMAPAAAVAFSLTVAVPYAGPSLPFAVALALIACLLVATALGQLAKHVPSAAGVYAYVSRGLGPEAGFVVGWCLLVFQPLVAPIVILLFAATTGDVVERELGWEIAGEWWIWVFVAVAIVTFLTLRGVRLSAGAGVALGAFEIAVFVALAVWMIVANLDSATLAPFDPTNAPEGTVEGTFKGMIFGILAFLGFEASAPLAEEARRPTCAIPRAVVLSVLAIGTLYVVAAYAMVVGTGFDSFVAVTASTEDPWRRLATIFWAGGWVLVFLAIANSAIAVCVALASGLAWGPRTAFVILATAGTIVLILVYVTVCVATIAFFRRRPDFNVLLHLVCPLLGAAAFLAPLYYQFDPLPPYPIRYGNWLAIGCVVTGLAVTAWMARKRRHALVNADRIFVAEAEA
jgi:amino acid transporter